MQRKPEIRVVHRNLRWEVEVKGVTRRLVDWLCTKERAIAHAEELAGELAETEGRPVAIEIDGKGEVLTVEPSRARVA